MSKHRNFSTSTLYFAIPKDKGKASVSNEETEETRSRNSDLPDNAASREEVKEDKGKGRASRDEPEPVDSIKENDSENYSSDEDLQKALAMSLGLDFNNDNKKGESFATGYQRATKINQYAPPK